MYVRLFRTPLMNPLCFDPDEGLESNQTSIGVSKLLIETETITRVEGL